MRAVDYFVCVCLEYIVYSKPRVLCAKEKINVYSTIIQRGPLRHA